jgi:tetratricopeptide (TPR) repeat protein
VSEWRKQAEQVYDEARRLAPDHPMVLLLGAGAGLDLEQYWIERERVSKLVQDAGPGWDFSYGRFLLFTGRARAALANLERARQNDPLNGLIDVNIADAYANTGNIPAAMEELERAATLHKTPQVLFAIITLQTAMAVNDIQAIHTQLPFKINNVSEALNRETASLASDKPALRAALQRAWSDPANRTLINSFTIAMWLAYAGDPALTLEVLNGIATTHVYNKAQVWTIYDADVTYRPLWWPLMRDVRRLPGFKDLVRKLGLAGYWRATGNWGEFCRPVSADDFECE